MNIFNQKKTSDIIGIDVGLYSIKAVELSQYQNNTKLVAYSEHTHNSVDGLSPKKLYKNISTLLNDPILGRFQSKKINISFPSNTSQNHFVTFNSKNKTDKERQIQEFITTKLNLDLSDYYFDNHLVSNNQNKQVHMIEVIKRSYLDRFNQYIQSAGLEISSVKSSGAVQLSNLIDQNQSGVILIDIGHNTTRLLFCHNSNCIEQRIDFGGDTVSSAISLEFDVSSQKSIELQKNVGIYGSKLADKINILVKDKLNEFISSIREFVNECSDIFDIEKSSEFQIYLTGSLVSMMGFSKFLQNNLNNPVNVVDPWKNISLYPLKPIPKYRLPKYASAIALAS